jgi:hypothetical protein
MALLFYWNKKHFDEEYNNRTGYLYSKSKRLIDSVNPGDNVWVFTLHEGNYKLVVKYIVDRKGDEEHNRHGNFSIKSKSGNYKYYDPSSQGNRFENLLRENLKPKNVRRLNEVIARHFQGNAHIWNIDDIVDARFDQYASKLRTL